MKRPSAVQQRVETLLTTCGIGEAPVDVGRVAQHLQLHVSEGELKGDISGFLYQDGAQTVIGINSAHPPARRRFTLAHEIGHFLLHNRDTTFVDRGGPNFLKRDARSSTGMDSREVEANAFAAELLMPVAFLARSLADRQDEADAEELIRDLAHQYGVSIQAMTIRLVRLGYIDTPTY